MGENDKQAFKSLMLANGELHGKEITTTLFQMYFSALKTYGIQQITKAFEAHTVDPEKGSFFPKPADIIKNVRKLNPTTNVKLLTQDYDFVNLRPREDDEKYILGTAELVYLQRGDLPPRLKHFTDDEVSLIRRNYGIA